MVNMDVIDSYFKLLSKWFNQIDLVSISLTVIIAFILCKITPAIVGWLSSRAVKPKLGESATISSIERKKRTLTLANLFSALIKAVIILTAIYAVLSDLGINLAPLIASAGIAGVALGFGAQNIVKDLLAGFFIILENQYRVDDVVDISAVGIKDNVSSGTVRAVTLRSTTLRDLEGNVHIIPNGNIVQVVNRTLGYSRFRFTFAVNTKTNIDELIRVINYVGQRMTDDPKWRKQIVSAPHYEELGRMGKQGVNVTVGGTTQPASQWRVSSEFRKQLVEELHKSDIEIADVE